MAQDRPTPPWSHPVAPALEAAGTPEARFDGAVGTTATAPTPQRLRHSPGEKNCEVLVLDRLTNDLFPRQCPAGTSSEASAPRCRVHLISVLCLMHISRLGPKPPRRAGVWTLATGQRRTPRPHAGASGPTTRTSSPVPKIAKSEQAEVVTRFSRRSSRYALVAFDFVAFVGPTTPSLPGTPWSPRERDEISDGVRPAASWISPPHCRVHRSPR